MLQLWGRPTAFNVQKVLWLLNEIPIRYELILAGGSYGGLNTPEFLALNPNGLVPVIKDDSTVVWESHSILRYLAARFGADRFWPQDPAVRSQADRFIDWAATTLQPNFLSGVFFGFFRTPDPQRNWPAIKESVHKCAQHFQMLDGILKHQKYLASDEFTLADIPAGSVLYRYFNLDIERPKVPHVEAWYQRLMERPAYREFVMVSFADMKGRMTY